MNIKKTNSGLKEFFYGAKTETIDIIQELLEDAYEIAKLINQLGESSELTKKYGPVSSKSFEIIKKLKDNQDGKGFGLLHYLERESEKIQKTKKLPFGDIDEDKIKEFSDPEKKEELLRRKRTQVQENLANLNNLEHIMYISKMNIPQGETIPNEASNFYQNFFNNFSGDKNEYQI